MAQIVKVNSAKKPVLEVITLISKLREIVEKTPSIKDKMAQSVGVSVANFTADYGIGSDAEAQALYDRFGALAAWLEGDDTKTAAEVRQNIMDLVDAFFVTA